MKWVEKRRIFTAHKANGHSEHNLFYHIVLLLFFFSVLLLGVVVIVLLAHICTPTAVLFYIKPMCVCVCVLLQFCSVLFKHWSLHNAWMCKRMRINSFNEFVIPLDLFRCAIEANWIISGLWRGEELGV